MPPRPSPLTLPALSGLAAIVPFVLMELINRRAFHEGFPVTLFVTLWLLAFAIVALLRPVLSRAASITAAGITGRLLLTGLLAYAWGAILLDQLPCFLGIPNCD
jgi:hypothetical protein